VIWYYYANKKTLDLKKTLQDQQTRRRGLARKVPVTTPTNSNVPRELANLGVGNSTWMSETGRVQRATVRGVNYTESREEQQLEREREAKLAAIKPPVIDQDCRWNEKEKEIFVEGLTKFGKDFKSISILMGSKSEFQCQNFYHNNKRKLNFDEILERCGMVKDKRRKVVGQHTNNQKEEMNEKERRTREERRVENTWTEQEKNDFMKSLAEHGKNWRKIAQSIPSKSQNQIKYYFQVSRDKFNLDQYLDPEE